ncbi:hypothetical protein [Paenibacillus wynnii]|uniref:Uncharacterized protein n=1 Tax=Paenibacillus wynnii TaxID=268407 RepID=A0A098MDK0_9BACL|nr:hypothetical protein [Paenibacillus wynnii]KGE20650.1 hypothetical protein PWYN_00115 [Paenibacillus wynnii]KGE20708.1 hypothetical protein PWYN_00540 [Paenibacillus wynnii]
MAKAKQKEIKKQVDEVSTAELAAIIGKTPQWVRQLTRDRILFQIGRGKYILSDSVQAYILHVSGGAKDDGKPTYTDYKTEHERIKSEKAALELAEIQGNMHSSDDVKILMGNMIITAKTKLLAIPSRVSPQLDGEPSSKVEQVLNHEIASVLKGLTEYNPALFDRKAGDGDDFEEDGDAV